MQITIHSDYYGDYKVDVNYMAWEREKSCLDLVLYKHVEIGVPLVSYLSIRTDGEIRLLKTEWGEANHYYHVYSAPSQPLTAAQEKSLAALWAGKVKELKIKVDEYTPYQLLHGVGATPQKLLSRSISDVLKDAYDGYIAIA